MKIYIGYDHRSVKMAYELMTVLTEAGHQVNEPFEDNSPTDDYPEIAAIVCDKVAADKKSMGILLCGTGIGMAIMANKHDGIRAVLAHNAAEAYFARRHENANVLVFAAGYDDGKMKVNPVKNYNEVVNTFLETEFEGDRHIRRLKKIGNFEKIN